MPLNPDSGWREMNIGVWSGLTTAEVIERHAVEWERLRAGEDLPRGGGETFAQFQERIIQSARRLAQRHIGEQIVIVTHGGVVRAFLLHCRNLPKANSGRSIRSGIPASVKSRFPLAVRR